MVPANRRSLLGNDFCNNYCHRVWLGNSHISFSLSLSLGCCNVIVDRNAKGFYPIILLWMQGHVTEGMEVPEVPRNVYEMVVGQPRVGTTLLWFIPWIISGTFSRLKLCLCPQSWRICTINVFAMRW